MTEMFYNCGGYFITEVLMAESLTPGCLACFFFLPVRHLNAFLGRPKGWDVTYKLLKGGKLVLDALMISQVSVCILSINALKWNSLIKTLGRIFFSL